MRFYRPRGSIHPASLWDPVAESPVYEFTRGICEVDDSNTELIAILTAMGFATEPIPVRVQVAMEINRDNSKTPPPPPPLFKDVPANEAEAKRGKK